MKFIIANREFNTSDTSINSAQYADAQVLLNILVASGKIYIIAPPAINCNYFWLGQYRIEDQPDYPSLLEVIIELCNSTGLAIPKSLANPFLNNFNAAASKIRLSDFSKYSSQKIFNNILGSILHNRKSILCYIEQYNGYNISTSNNKYLFNLIYMLHAALDIISIFQIHNDVSEQILNFCVNNICFKTAAARQDFGINLLEKAVKLARFVFILPRSYFDTNCNYYLPLSQQRQDALGALDTMHQIIALAIVNQLQSIDKLLASLDQTQQSCVLRTIIFIGIRNRSIELVKYTLQNPNINLEYTDFNLQRELARLSTTRDRRLLHILLSNQNIMVAYLIIFCKITPQELSINSNILAQLSILERIVRDDKMSFVLQILLSMPNVRNFIASDNHTAKVLFWAAVGDEYSNLLLLLRQPIIFEFASNCKSFNQQITVDFVSIFLNELQQRGPDFVWLDQQEQELCYKILNCSDRQDFSHLQQAILTLLHKPNLHELYLSPKSVMDISAIEPDLTFKKIKLNQF